MKHFIVGMIDLVYHILTFALVLFMRVLFTFSNWLAYIHELSGTYCVLC